MDQSFDANRLVVSTLMFFGSGIYHAALLVLFVSGLSKLVKPEVAGRALSLASPVKSSMAVVLIRCLAVGEIVLAAMALMLGWLSVGVALVYFGFAWFVRRLSAADGQAGCGCFGASDDPPGPFHVAVNIGLGVNAALYATWVAVGHYESPVVDWTAAHDTTFVAGLAHMATVVALAATAVGGPAAMASLAKAKADATSDSHVQVNEFQLIGRAGR